MKEPKNKIKGQNRIIRRRFKICLIIERIGVIGFKRGISNYKHKAKRGRCKKEMIALDNLSLYSIVLF